MEIDNDDIMSVGGGAQNMLCICRIAKQIISKKSSQTQASPMKLK